MYERNFRSPSRPWRLARLTKCPVTIDARSFPTSYVIGHNYSQRNASFCGGIGIQLILQFKWRNTSRATKCCTWVQSGSVCRHGSELRLIILNGPKLAGGGGGGGREFGMID